MSDKPRNICPFCHAPFTVGSAYIASSEDIKVHYWWHKLEAAMAPLQLNKGKERQ